METGKDFFAGEGSKKDNLFMLIQNDNFSVVLFGTAILMFLGILTDGMSIKRKGDSNHRSTAIVRKHN